MAAGWRATGTHFLAWNVPCVFPLEPPAPAPFLIPDCRRPGRAMAPLPLKVPAEAAAQLQAAADRLGTSRTALGRALLLQGLAQLEASTTRAA